MAISGSHSMFLVGCNVIVIFSIFLIAKAVNNSLYHYYYYCVPFSLQLGADRYNGLNPLFVGKDVGLDGLVLLGGGLHRGEVEPEVVLAH